MKLAYVLHSKFTILEICGPLVFSAQTRNIYVGACDLVSLRIRCGPDEAHA